MFYESKKDISPNQLEKELYDLVGAGGSTSVKGSDSSKDITSQLKELKELLDAGALTQEEFEKAKKKLLN